MVDDSGAAMNFAEIARAMGYRDPEDRGRKAVFMVYQHALRKLRQRPARLKRLIELAAARQKLADARSARKALSVEESEEGEC